VNKILLIGSTTLSYLKKVIHLYKYVWKFVINALFEAAVSILLHYFMGRKFTKKFTVELRAGSNSWSNVANSEHLYSAQNVLDIWVLPMSRIGRLSWFSIICFINKPCFINSFINLKYNHLWHIVLLNSFLSILPDYPLAKALDQGHTKFAEALTCDMPQCWIHWQKIDHAAKMVGHQQQGQNQSRYPGDRT